MKIKVFAFLIWLIVFLVALPSYSANRYWVGTAILGNWNNILNWSATSGGLTGLSVPGPSDVAIFDGGGTNNCTVDANINVAGIQINSSYSGTISLNSGVTTIVAATGFSQAGGIFIANNGSITINSSFNLTGGTFTSTSGTLQISSGYTYSAGTFNHNNGTVSFSTAQTITGSSTFYTILFVACGGSYAIASGTTLTSLNNVTISGGASCTINTGTVEIKGDLTLANSSNNTVNGGSATFLFNGTGVQNINSAIGSIVVGTNERICALPNVEINKISGSLTLNGVINLNGATWKTTAGAALINPGTSTVNIISAITFSGQNLSLFNIHIWANNQMITLSPASYILTSTNNLTINGGGYYQVNTGILEIVGDLNLVSTLSSAVNGGTGTFLFDGTGIQNINSSAGSLNSVCSLPNVQINKSSGSLNLIGIINLGGTSWNTVAGGVLINAGTSVVNILKTTTLSGQNIILYDLVVTGTFNTITINAGLTWTCTHLLTLAGGTSWYQINTGTINAKGDVLVTNTNTSNNVGGSAVLLFDGNADQTLTGSGISGGGRLPQVQINKTGGTLMFSGIISTDHNWNYIAGNVDAKTNATTVDFYKTSVIDAQGALGTMVFNNVIFSGFISLGGNIDVDGDFTIRTGVNNRIDVNAAGNYQVNVAGNWINNNSVTASSFNQQNGKVVFDGGAAQSLTLALATHLEIFYNLEINNTSSGLTLSAPVTVSNNVNFVAGNIISSVTAILLLNNAVTATGASNSSFVSGPVCKTGNQAFTFPVGKNGLYAPISISAPSVNTNQFTAEYFQVDPNINYDVNSKDPVLNHLSRCEYWILDRTTGVSNVSVTLSWDTRSCAITNISDLKIAQWNGTLWTDQGNGGTTGTNANGTIVSLSAVSSYGPFTLSSGTANNPLPLKLNYFAGSCDNNSIILNWQTAINQSKNYFTIEYSTNKVDWKVIGKVAEGDNSSPSANYSFADGQLHDNFSYYRLKQTDIDGSFDYSTIIVVQNCNTNEPENIFVYPNPSNGTFKISMDEDQAKDRIIEIVNSMGQRVYMDKQIEISLTDQPEGIYFLYLHLDSKIIVEKIVVKK